MADRAPTNTHDDQLVEDIAGMLSRIEINYLREGSGPGSRFEGQRLEVAQAKAVIRRVRGDLAPLLDEVQELCNLADRVDQLRQAIGLEDM